MGWCLFFSTFLRKGNLALLWQLTASVFFLIALWPYGTFCHFVYFLFYIYLKLIITSHSLRPSFLDA
jgi:hypothetical protein